jgi:hypothetical protein
LAGFLVNATLTPFCKTAWAGPGMEPGFKRLPVTISAIEKKGRIPMKKFAIPAVFAVFAVGAMVNSVAVSATIGPKAAAEAAKSAPAMPVTQELPFNRYWSKD